MIKEFNDSQPQVDYFREYTPDVVAALSNLGQTGGYYDANGHYARTQPFFGAFGVNGANQLTDVRRRSATRACRWRTRAARGRPCSRRPTARRRGWSRAAAT